MPALDLLKHFFNVVYGLGACVLCFGLLYLSGRGLVALLGRWPRTAARPRVAAPRFVCDGYPAVLMASIYIIWCWYGIKLGVGLITLVWVFWGVVFALVIVDWPEMAAWRRQPLASSRETLRWLIVFAFFYVVAYAFFTPTVSGEDLPLASYINNDLMNYLNFTRALQDLRSSNVVGLSILASPFYFQTPGAYYVIGLLATFFRMDPMHAAMPALFGFCALMALVAARISRAMFSVSFLWAIAIGATLISGPFFRYIAGNYFLSTLISLPVVIHLIWQTTSLRVGSIGVMALAGRCAAHYLVLLVMYPVLLLIALALQASIVSTRIVWSLLSPHRRGSDERRRAVQGGSVIALALALMIAAMPQRAVTATQVVVYQSHVGVGGWPLEFISPLALIGFPGAADRLEIGELEHPGVVLASLAALLILLIASYFWWARSSTKGAERVWVTIGAGSVLAYCSCVPRARALLPAVEAGVVSAAAALFCFVCRPRSTGGARLRRSPRVSERTTTRAWRRAAGGACVVLCRRQPARPRVGRTVTSAFPCLARQPRRNRQAEVFPRHVRRDERLRFHVHAGLFHPAQAAAPHQRKRPSTRAAVARPRLARVAVLHARISIARQ